MTAPEPLHPLLEAWLPTQRWFAGKGREASIDVAPLAVLVAASPEVTIWTARVAYDDGSAELYQLPLVERDRPDRKSTRLNSSHHTTSRMPSSA